MSDEWFYYRARTNHKEIFGTEEPASFHELFFAVEAPRSFSEIEIRNFTEKIDIRDIYPHKHTLLKKEEAALYPFYDLFTLLWKGETLTPFVLELRRGDLVSIEGRHRLRLLWLLHEFEPGRFKDKIGRIDCVVVSVVDTRGTPRYPKRYFDWVESLGVNSWKKEANERRALYEKFLLKE